MSGLVPIEGIFFDVILQNLTPQIILLKFFQPSGGEINYQVLMDNELSIF